MDKVPDIELEPQQGVSEGSKARQARKVKKKRAAPKGVAGKKGKSVSSSSFFQNRSLTSRLVIAISGLLALSLVSITAFSALRTRATLVQQTQADFAVRSEEVADQLSFLLESYVRGAQVAAVNNTVVEAVENRNESYTSNSDAILASITALDTLWREGDLSLITSVLSAEPNINPASAATLALQTFDAMSDTYVETFITDRYGATIASTQRLSDYYQADEDWWQAAWNNGSGALYISEPELDASINVLSLLIALPIIGEDGSVTGVFRTTVEASALVNAIVDAEFGSTGRLELFNASAQEIVAGRSEEGVGSDELPAATLTNIIQADRGATVADDRAGNSVFFGFAPISLEQGVPNWTLVLRQDASEALAPVSQIVSGGIFATIIALALAIALAFLLARSLTRPIQALVGVAEKVSKGDLSQTAKVQTRDEIGALAETFNQAIAGLRQVEEKNELERERSAQLQQNVSAFLDVAMDIAEGDFTKRGDVTEDVLGNIVDAINLMVEEVAALLTQTQDAAQGVNSGAAEMIATTQAIAQSAQRQAAQAQRARSETEQVTLSIRKMAEQADASAEASTKALEASRQGEAAVQNTLRGMQGIRSEVQSISERTKSLTQRSDEISGVVRSMSRIASQTNLLALSASLEAAGAGEAGTRFATVANEVQTLAEESANAARQVGSIVRELQSEIREVAQLTESGSQEVEAGYKVASEAGERLREIAEISTQSAELAKLISQATQEQVQGVVGVNEVVQAMAEISQASQGSVSQGRDAAERLQGLAAQLTEGLSRFRLVS